MKVLIVNPRGDCAGVGYGLARAAREAGHDAHSVAGERNYLDYPKDWMWDEDREEILSFKPDLWVLSNGSQACIEMLGFEPKNVVVYFHGSDIRYGKRPNYNKNTREFVRAKGWPVYVSTLDLEWIVPDSEWLPPAIDVENVATWQEAHDGFVISHAPTNRKLKGTNHLIEAAHFLRGQGHDIELDFIEQVPNQEALRRKGLSDVHFDQLMFGYGVNALEAMCMGVPVIAGATNPLCADYFRERLGDLPFLDSHTLESAPVHIAGLIRSLFEPETQMLYAKKGLEYVRQHHDPKVVGKNLTRIFEAAA